MIGADCPSCGADRDPDPVFTMRSRIRDCVIQNPPEEMRNPHFYALIGICKRIAPVLQVGISCITLVLRFLGLKTAKAEKNTCFSAFHMLETDARIRIAVQKCSAFFDM